MPFTLNLSTKADVDDSVVKEYDAEFRVALAENGVAAQFASIKRDFQAESISLPKYDQLSLATTPLTEDEDVTSEKLVDSKVVVTPVEYGNVVTTTKLASLTTSSMSDKAAAKLVGINAGRTDNKLALLAMDASTNILYASGTDEISTVAGDIMTGTIMGEAFNKMGRKNALGVANGDFVMIAHDDVIHDLREANAAGSWLDVHKYSKPEDILRNEVGRYKGFRVVRDNLSTINVDGGAGTVDTYTSYCIGMNAFGKGSSMPITMRATGPFDKLSRFVNLGWHGVFAYKIVEQDALWLIKSASSVGAN